MSNGFISFLTFPLGFIGGGRGRVFHNSISPSKQSRLVSPSIARVRFMHEMQNLGIVGFADFVGGLKLCN